MNTNQKGALPDKTIEEMLRAHMIYNILNLAQIQPASLDLTISDEVYEVGGSILPKSNERVKDLLGVLRNKKFDFSNPLEINKTYLICLNESLALFEDIYGYANPKSSTGRVDLHVRMLSDGFSRYDGCKKGYKGALWIVVTPKSFRTYLKPGLALNQIRFFNSDTRFDHLQLGIQNAQEPLVWDQETREPVPWEQLSTFDRDGSVILRSDLRTGFVGWVAKQTDTILDLSRTDNDPDVFFEKIDHEGGHIILKKDKFYIMSTYESVRIPPCLASEIAPMDERSGEFRTHYAGFFDPGWGWGQTGEGCGDTATLEVRPYEDVMLRHLDPIARFKFELMAELPKTKYGPANNYAGQVGPQLGKYFRGFGKS